VRAAIHVVAKTSPKDGRIMSEGDVTPDVDARTSMDACMTFCCNVLLTDRSSILYTKHSATDIFVTSSTAKFNPCLIIQSPMLKDTLYERFGLHSQNPYDQCKTLP
jgi:hypothetical protein